MRLKHQVISRSLLSVILVISLLLSITVPAYADDRLSEIRYILDAVYVDPVAADVLAAPNVEELLKRLGDPHTQYFTPQEYQEFIRSIDNTFSGIGIYIDVAPEGILVTGVVSGSPAEASGLSEGDVITHVDGTALAGKALEYGQSLIRGEEGTSVRLTVKRGTSSLEFSIVRKKIEIPTVTGKVLNGHIGYLELNSFGSDTSELLEKLIKQMKSQGVDSWIVDLRNNPGGYMNTALDIAGYFVGSKVALQTQDRSGERVKYNAYSHGFVLEEPLIVLVNEWSASASEILASALKDHARALIVGTKTYGKGTVQSIYELGSGGALKVTTARFYSALGKTINGTGVQPDLTIKDNPLKVAELLLAQVNRDSSKLSQRQILKTAIGDFYLDVLSMQKPENWAAARALFESVKDNSSVQLLEETAQGWKEISTERLNNLWSLYYKGYKQVGLLNEVPLDKKFTVKFTAPFAFESVSNQSIELVDAASGERLELKFNELPNNSLEVVSSQLLKPQTTYYLIIHNTIRDGNGQQLKEGAIAVVETGTETTAETKTTMRTMSIEETTIPQAAK